MHFILLFKYFQLTKSIEFNYELNTGDISVISENLIENRKEHVVAEK